MTIDRAEEILALPVVRDVVAAKIAAAARDGEVAGILWGALLAIFSARGDTPSRDGRLVLEGMTDLATLCEWIRRAADGESSEEILREPGSSRLGPVPPGRAVRRCRSGRSRGFFTKAPRR